jgi:hypothetical protein
MIVMPTIAKRKYCQDQIIAAPVSTIETPASEGMSDRVNAVDSVVDQYRAYKKAPGQHLQSRSL